MVERNFFGDTLTMMQYWKVRNKSIVAIFDDAYDIMLPQNVSYPFWEKGEIKGRDSAGHEKILYMRPLPLEQFKWGMKMVKGIQVPSVNLAKDWSKYNNTYYVHNYLDPQRYVNQEPLLPHPKEELYIGWCGSMSHFSSFKDSGAADALRKISRKYPQVKILIGGDKRVFDLIETKNKVFQPYVPEDKWASLLTSLDIAIAPLSGEYDKRRSWIKVLEYLYLKIPWIATNYITYDEFHDFGIITENGYNNWFNSISEMIENYPKYKELVSTKGYEFALSQLSENNVAKVTLPLYQKLIDAPYLSQEKQYDAHL